MSKSRSTKAVIEPTFYGYYYGMHSSGNINSLLPLIGDVVQFWTHEHGGVTYCVKKVESKSSVP